ncbi:hypothetical protein PGTUg99_023591 [Puccinia graminis f. sp. tritici]|uniref:HAT C-terminal dimerisation domain-containing protein n=1 Tax=Puccinia graminis f. sp. tritici TaxID=56615 RepID=A0A5B0PJB8_PUCGR|nr:hypothetical protein PGTUg99_023591 [Puccinia graminis f. sp. tritici]
MKEKKALNNQPKEVAMRKMVDSNNFDNTTFNQLLVMWIIQHLLPWVQIEDFILVIAFQYLCHVAKPYTRVWAATEAHQLYCHLQSKVLDSLQSNTSKLSLIHNIWTTRGNQNAFLGITVAYIDGSWKIKVSHLLVKYIAWTHKGKYLVIPLANILLKSTLNNKITQTTDSGSNNLMMAVELDLILNAGLKSILVPQSNQIPTSTVLGFVPGLCAIAKESSESGQVDPMANPFDQDGFVDDSDSNYSDNKGPAVREANAVEKVLKKVDYVTQKITSSLVKQADFNTWAKKLKYTGPTLIAGYGIRWNIKFESRERGYITQNVINKLIENKQDRQDHKGGKNHFNKYKITQSNWDIVKKLNDIISELYYVTKKMEGNIPLASMVLAKYRLLRQYLEGKLSTVNKDEFKNMINTILKKIDTYLPPVNDPEVVPLGLPLRTNLLEAKFQQHKQALNDQASRDEDTPPPEKNTTLEPGGGLEEDDNFFLDAAPETYDELAATVPQRRYDTVSGQYSTEFPVVALLEQDYLATSATSASVEQCFLAAADVWGQDQGINPDGPFQAAQDTISATQAKLEAAKTTKKPVASTSSVKV